MSISEFLGRYFYLIYKKISFWFVSEYGLGNEVSTHGDVYSYGIVLLEMFIGKRPTDNEFVGAMGLHKYVQMALPDRVSTIMDQQLRMEIEDGEPATSNSKLRISCIASILQVGISCSEEMPMDRVSIGDALKELQAIRDKFQKLLCSEEASSSH
jgi:serine/threonine protein kinase